MPTPAPTPLRVAECGSCQQLFAVYATEGAVACPSCGLPVEIATLETASLGIAEPIEVRIEAPAVVAPEEVPAEVASDGDPAAETDKPPTVAEWLMRHDEPSASTVAEASPATEPQPEPAAQPAAKPTLSESLGWKEALPGFDPPATEEPAPPSAESAQPSNHPTASQSVPESSQPPADEFRFDFGSTPLSETPDGSEAVSLDLTTPIQSAVIQQGGDDTTPLEREPSQPVDFLWDGAKSETERPGRGWWKPLSTLAAVLLVAAGTGFTLMNGTEDSAAVAQANRGGRLLESSSEEEATPPDPLPAATPIVSTEVAEFTVPPPEPFGDAPIGEPDPIVDPATRTAGYEAPPLEDLPPAVSAPAPLNERYASFEADTLADLPPADQPQPPALPQPAAQAAVDRPQIGLVGVPLTTVDQLVVATADAAQSGQAFVANDLADREQVPVLGQHYAQLSFLAQTLTLLDPAEQSPQRFSAEMEVVDIFEKLFRGSRGRSQSLKIAGPWINWPDRPYGGVFFSGDPSEVSRAGSVIRYDFRVGEQTVPVLMAEKIDTQRLLITGAVELGVLGVIVEEPQKWIAGYEGDAERVVWARKIIPLRPPVEL